MIIRSIFALLLAISVTGCYRMPTDEDYCLVPNINNRDITREKNTNPMGPNVGF